MTIDVDVLKEIEARAEQIKLITNLVVYKTQLKLDYLYIKDAGRNVSDRETYKSLYDNTLSS